MLEVVSYSFGGVPLLALAGDLDHSGLATFRTETDKALQAGGNRLLLQLTDTAYIDSGGVSSLLTILHRVRHKGWLGVIAPSSDVLRILQMVGITIDPNFRVFSSLDDVEAFLQQGAASA